MGCVSRRVLGLVVVLAGAGACKPGMIAGTQVENTMQNREIVGVVEAYRKAMETRDPAQVLKLTSTEYFEDAGTSDPTDDYSFAGLEAHLKDVLGRVQALRLDIRVLRVEVDGDRAHADYRYQVRSLVSYPSGDQWLTRTDDNRLSFRREGGRWRIVAGL